MPNQVPPSPFGGLRAGPTRVRICSHITQTRFLHVEDALNIGKLRLFAGNYRRGQGMDSHTHHFIDLADARVIFAALARGEQGFNHKEYKGTPPQNARAAVSRVMSVTVKGENAYIELKTGPGKLTNTGAITPNGKPDVEVNVGFKLYEARRLAASVLAYIQAWDVLRVMANQHLVSQPAPYLVVSATSDANGINSFASAQDRPAPSQAASGVPKPRTSPPTPVVAGNDDRPVTRKGSTPKINGAAVKPANGVPVVPVTREVTKPDTAVLAQALYGPDEATGSNKQPLRYGSGAVVDGSNAVEVQTFQRYVAEKKTVPESKAVLLAYYRERIRKPADVANR